jgi:hypothetical protein
MDARPFWPRLPSEACTAKKLKRAVCASERTAPHQQPALLHARVRSQSPRFCRPIAKNITLVSTSIYVRSGVHSSEVASCRGAAVLFFLRSISIDQQNACTHHQDPHDASPVISTRCVRDQKKKRSGKRSMWPHRTIAVRLPVGISDHTIQVPPRSSIQRLIFLLELITKIIIRMYRKLRDESIKSN